MKKAKKQRSRKGLYIGGVVALVLAGIAGGMWIRPHIANNRLVARAGWQVLTNETYGIQALVPLTATREGCTLPVALGVTDGSLSLGTLWTPCLADHKGNESFDDTFSGYSPLYVETNIFTAEQARAAFEETWGGKCSLNINSLETNNWSVVAVGNPPNAWTPTNCELLDTNRPPVNGFYNRETKTFVYWVAQPDSFQMADGTYADGDVKILPLERGDRW